MGEFREKRVKKHFFKGNSKWADDEEEFKWDTDGMSNIAWNVTIKLLKVIYFAK